MKLLSFWMIAFVISVCIALPANDNFGPQDDSQQPRNVQARQWSNFVTRDLNRMYSHISLDSQPSEERGIQISDLPEFVFHNLALRMLSDDVINLAHVSRSFRDAPAVTVIQGIL